MDKDDLLFRLEQVPDVIHAASAEFAKKPEHHAYYKGLIDAVVEATERLRQRK